MAATDLLDELRGFTAQLDDLTPVFERVVDDFAHTVQEVFDTEGGSIGAPWEPLAPAWVRHRIRHGKGTDPLRYSTSRGGRILASLTDRSSRFHVRDIRSDEVRVGSRFGLTAQHHQGMTRTIQWGPNQGRSYTVPSRPVFDMSQEISERWSGLVDQHVHGGQSQGRFGL